MGPWEGEAVALYRTELGEGFLPLPGAAGWEDSFPRSADGPLPLPLLCAPPSLPSSSALSKGLESLPRNQPPLPGYISCNEALTIFRSPA